MTDFCGFDFWIVAWYYDILKYLLLSSLIFILSIPPTYVLKQLVIESLSGLSSLGFSSAVA